jgi:hypothetical protein
MGFSFPHPPIHLAFSPSAQTGAEIVSFAAAAAFLIFAVLEFRKLRVGAVLAAAGAGEDQGGRHGMVRARHAGDHRVEPRPVHTVVPGGRPRVRNVADQAVGT